MIPRSTAFDDTSPTKERQYVFFIRHGESRWNQAQESRSVLGMFSESDHGLTDRGRLQAEQLRAEIATQRDALQGAATDFDSARSAAWLHRFLRPDLVCASPFTRAMQTCFIALTELLMQKTGKLVVMKEAREQKNLGGADCGGVALGEDHVSHVKEEMENLYTSADQRSKLARLLLCLAQIDIDVSDIHTTWWSSVVELDADISDRTKVFLRKLYEQGDGSSSIVVGHSHFFRRIFQDYIGEEVLRKQPDVAASLQKFTMPQCGVVGVRLDWTVDGKLEITDVMPILGTELQKPDSTDEAEACSPEITQEMLGLG